jgi:hypothetical protein
MLRPEACATIVAMLNAQQGIYELNYQLLRVFEKLGKPWRFRA